MITGLNHITIAVSDLEKSLDFYINLLGFKGHVKWDKGAYLSAGDLWFCLSIDKPEPKSDYTHIAFDIARQDFSKLAKKLVQANVVQWKQNKSEGDSLYILDPDGHKLELHSGKVRIEISFFAKKAIPRFGLALRLGKFLQLTAYSYPSFLYLSCNPCKKFLNTWSLQTR